MRFPIVLIHCTTGDQNVVVIIIELQLILVRPVSGLHTKFETVTTMGSDTVDFWDWVE